MSVSPGQTIDGKYKVGRLIGEGGMGTVYEGENVRIGRRVAIKVLHTQVASMPEFAERFEREARVAARVGSPHVCDVLDLGDLPNGDRYIVMEYLDGVSFEDRIVQKGQLTAQELAPIAFELLEGLGTMHNARVVHRDLKPANVFLARHPGGRGEVVKILDFGVAKLLPFENEIGTMTKTGSMMGTPLYMSPEQARGARDVDGRTDIYAASVMFYRALAGILPYNADTLNELLFKIVLEDPKPLREIVPDVDEMFAGIIHKGLARDVDQRFMSAREYQEAIAAWGKTQGRTSLQFAVTLTSDPPPFLSSIPKQSAARAPDTKANAAPAVSAAATGVGGTPIAWSEGKDEAGPPATRMSGRGPAASSPDDSPSKQLSESGRAVVSSSQGGAVSGVAHTIVSPGSSTNNEAVAAQATTGPSAAQLAREAEKKGSRTKLFAAVGVIALVVGGGIVFGIARAGSGTSTNGAPPPAATDTTPKDPATVAAPPPPATTTATPVATAAPSDTASATATAEPTAAKPIVTATGATRPTMLPATAKPAAEATAKPAASTAPAATTATPPASAKPAASARKFRTNID